MTNNHTDLKEAVWDYCVKSAREESWSRDELYAVIDSCFAKHTDSVETTIEEILNDNRGETLYDSENANEIAADAIDNFIEAVLPKLQAHTSQQVEEAVLQADATGAYHSGYLAGKAEVEEAVKKRIIEIMCSSGFTIGYYDKGVFVEYPMYEAVEIALNYPPKKDVHELQP